MSMDTLVKKPGPFAVIGRYSNWGYEDELGGYILAEGETLVLEWPNGDMFPIQIGIEEGTMTYSDMGHEMKGRNHRAYVCEVVHGAMVRIYIHGWRAARLNPPKGQAHR
jgi:hypothetical protein